MNVLLNVLVGIQTLAALGMIGLVLLQHGKGADVGAAFGSGSAGSLFGASGSANFLSRITAALATVFFVCTLTLAYFGHARISAGTSVMERAAVPAAPASAPAAAPASPAASPAQIPVTPVAPSAPGSAPAAAGAPAPTAPGQIPVR